MFEAGRVISFCPRSGGLVNRTFHVSVLALFTLAAAPHAQAQTSEASMEKKIEALFSGATSPDAPGLAVLGRQNAQTVLEPGYGVGDPPTKWKIDARSNFRPAS